MADDAKTETTQTPQSDEQKAETKKAEAGLIANLQEERNKRQELENRLQTLEEAKEQAESATLTEQQKYQRELDKVKARAEQAETELKQTRRKTNIISSPVASQLHDVNDAVLNLGLDNQDWEDPSKIESALNQLKESKPHLFKSETGPGSLGAPPAGSGGASTPTNGDEVSGNFWRQFATGQLPRNR